MGLLSLRRWTRIIAAVVLLTSVWQLPHRLQDDELCLPAAVEHDESKHVFTGVTLAGHQDHCAICHWTRWLKPDFSGAAALVSDATPGAALLTLAVVHRRDPASDQLPSRAPPSPRV